MCVFGMREDFSLSEESILSACTVVSTSSLYLLVVVVFRLGLFRLFMLLGFVYISLDHDELVCIFYPFWDFQK